MTSERKQMIRADIQAKHASVAAVLARVTESDWGTPVYSPDHAATWTVHDVIAHLLDSTEGQLRTARMIANGEDPLPPDFDLQRWNKRTIEKAANKDTAEMIATVRDNFEAWLQFLDEVPEEALDKKGRYPSGDIETVANFIVRFARHEAAHAADLDAALRG